MIDLVYLATAPDEMTAEIWVARLQEAGIPAMIRPGDAVSFLGTSPMPCRVLVGEPYLEQARELLGEGVEGEDNGTG